MRQLLRVSRWRWILTGLAFCSSAIMLWSAFSPIPMRRQEIALSVDRFLVDDEQKTLLSFLEGQRMILSWPSVIRKGEQSVISIQLLLDEADQGAEESSVRQDDIGENVVMVARLELAGIDAFQGETREPIRAGQNAFLRWDLISDQIGLNRGKLWLYLDLISAQTGRINQVLVLVRPIEIETRTVAGLSLSTARVVGLACIGIGLVVLFPGFNGIGKSRTDRPVDKD